MPQPLKGRVAFITGASSGIGANLAIEFARRGVHLALAARRLDLLANVKSQCETHGVTVRIYQCDVVQSDQVQTTVAAINQDFGQIDIVIANAGISGAFKAKRFDTALANQIIDVNVKGVLNTVGAVLPDMHGRNSGIVVGISSLASYISFPQSYVYSASKSAVNAIFTGLRRELRFSKIQVTTICPGFIRSEMTATNQFPMPFLMDVDVAARRIVNAIERGDAVYNFPRRLHWTIRLLSFVPERLMTLPFRKGARLKI